MASSIRQYSAKLLNSHKFQNGKRLQNLHNEVCNPQASSSQNWTPSLLAPILLLQEWRTSHFLQAVFSNLTSLLSDMTKKEETFHDAKLCKVLNSFGGCSGQERGHANLLGAFLVEQLSDGLLENLLFLTASARVPMNSEYNSSSLDRSTWPLLPIWS
jgi:hypothetical protein